jgi:hypothetical protein
VFVHPADGYAYSRIELAAIDELASTEEEALTHLEHRRKYFALVDPRLAERIEEAMWAEVTNLDPIAPGECNFADCEVHERAEERPASQDKDA